MADEQMTPKEKGEEVPEEAKGTAAGVATGLGCLAFGLLPWSLIALIVIVLIILWFFRQGLA
jgi:hypothetical protein